jgi:hypothetical protein
MTRQALDLQAETAAILRENEALHKELEALKAQNRTLVAKPTSPTFSIKWGPPRCTVFRLSESCTLRIIEGGTRGKGRPAIMAGLYLTELSA